MERGDLSSDPQFGACDELIPAPPSENAAVPSRRVSVFRGGLRQRMLRNFGHMLEFAFEKKCGITAKRSEQF